MQMVGCYSGLLGIARCLVVAKMLLGGCEVSKVL